MRTAIAGASTTPMFESRGAINKVTHICAILIQQGFQVQMFKRSWPWRMIRNGVHVVNLIALNHIALFPIRFISLARTASI